MNVCQPGNNLLAAGYCLYSSSVVFTISIGKGVFAFTLDPTYGEFVLTHPNIKIPSLGKIYSFNEGNYDLWDNKLKKYIDHLREPTLSGKPYSGRYIGCLVGEIHRMLLVGGIYGNPANVNNTNGNLRLLYECAPMSYLIEQAGGKAIDGQRRILDIEPTKVMWLYIICECVWIYIMYSLLMWCCWADSPALTNIHWKLRGSGEIAEVFGLILLYFSNLFLL